MELVQEGRLLGPVPLSPDGQPLFWSSKRYNVSFRFGVLQADKLRACDDLVHSMANLTCTVETPIQLLSWGNIAQLSAMLSAGGGDWVMFKADRKAAYIQLPIDSDDQNAAIIALLRPAENRWYGFVTRTLIFGSVADVIRYNVSPRILDVLANRYFGIPMVRYFDVFIDYPQVDGDGGPGRFRSLLLLPAFSDEGWEIAGWPYRRFRGLLGRPPFKANGRKLPISPPVGKRANWPALLYAYLKEWGDSPPLS